MREHEINYQRARRVIDRVHTAYAQRHGLLADVQDLLENQIPSGVEPLSKAHANFLFFVVPNDHGTKSAAMYSRAKELFARDPAVFDADAVLRRFRDMNDVTLQELVTRPIGARYPAVAARSWYRNATRLAAEFGCDSRELFGASPDAVELLQLITSYSGYGPKTGGMLLRAIVGLGFARVSNLERVLVPVDVHDTRIAFFTGMITSSSWEDEFDYQPFVKKVQRMLLDTCNDLGIEWLDADRALWLIGSRGCVTRRCNLCPIQEFCSVGRSELEDRAGPGGSPSRV